MQQFATGPQRADVYRRYKFRVMHEGRPVAGVSQVSLLRALAEGDLPQAGATLSLRRGLTRDRDFERWAEQGRSFGGAALELVPEEPRPSEPVAPRDLIIECYDDAGRKVTSYHLRGCQPAELVARQASGPDPDLLAISRLTLRAEAWVREPAAG